MKLEDTIKINNTISKNLEIALTPLSNIQIPTTTVESLNEMMINIEERMERCQIANVALINITVNYQEILNQIAITMMSTADRLSEVLLSIRQSWFENIDSIMFKTIDSLNVLANCFQNNELNEITLPSTNASSIIRRDTGYLLRKEIDDFEEQFDNRLAVKITKSAQRILGYLTKIESLKPSMIRLTSLMFLNSGTLVGTICENDVDILNVTKACYQIFYEGFGKDNHSSVEYISFDEYPALGDIKHIRLFYEHDIEHGNIKDINKKKDIMQEMFMRLAGKKTLVNSKDYKTYQYNLYSEIECWLEALLNKLAI